MHMNDMTVQHPKSGSDVHSHTGEKIGGRAQLSYRGVGCRFRVAIFVAGGHQASVVGIPLIEVVLSKRLNLRQEGGRGAQDGESGRRVGQPHRGGGGEREGESGTGTHDGPGVAYP